MEQTIKCPICGRPYKFYPFSAADQSACPKCVQEAEKDLVTVPDEAREMINMFYQIVSKPEAK